MSKEIKKIRYLDKEYPINLETQEKEKEFAERK